MLPWNELAAYVPTQIAGGIAGTVLAHLMFGEPLIQASTHVRTGLGVWTGEAVATIALLMTIVGCLRSQPRALPYAVGLIITAGYWFTSSTSFANPAVAIARSLTNTFSGIRPQDVPGFIAAELVGALLATIAFRWLFAGDAADTPGRKADGRQINTSVPNTLT